MCVKMSAGCQQKFFNLQIRRLPSAAIISIPNLPKYVPHSQYKSKVKGRKNFIKAGRKTIKAENRAKVPLKSPSIACCKWT